MRLATFSDYSLRMLLYVAGAPDGRATIREVARAFDVSEHHLVKVAHFLGHEGLLANTRGRHGGLRLARAARDINLAMVVRAAEGGDLLAECFEPESSRCAIAGRCRLQRALREAMEGFYSVLARYTLEDLRLAPRLHGRLVRMSLAQRAA
jgi:Rrf2 family transcriptional regulator, nitric oxide-sensitive transcriptional repressor